MQNTLPNFQPISKALYLLELTRGNLESSKEQFKNMQEVKNKPHILDDEMIDRSIRLYTAQNEHNNITLRQFRIRKLAVQQ